jgi:hypothetical protein
MRLRYEYLDPRFRIDSQEIALDVHFCSRMMALLKVRTRVRLIKNYGSDVGVGDGRDECA